ncbi:MAG: aldo/keto reductase [Halobacteria archaeon]
MGAMRTAMLGRTGEKLSVIGAGTWQWGALEWGWGGSYGKRQALEAFDRALALGVNWLDTAEIYGPWRSEQVIGEALGERRDGVFVASKVMPFHSFEKACAGSRRRLGVDAIDLYQVHWPNPLVPVPAMMRAMERLKKRGWIRHIGVSNFPAAMLREAREALPRSEVVSNQVKYNLLEREAERDLLPACRKWGVTLIAYSPLAQGALSGKYTPDHQPSDWVRRAHPLFSRENLRRAVPLITALRKVGKRRGRSVSQTALNWLVHDPRVVAIPGAKSAGQAEENARGGDWLMAPAELRSIEAAARGVDLATGPLARLARLRESLPL